MNERILELAETADIKFDAHLSHMGIDTAVITSADLRKFAELIIWHATECVRDVLRDENSDLSYDAASQVQNRIREYFGRS